MPATQSPRGLILRDMSAHIWQVVGVRYELLGYRFSSCGYAFAGGDKYVGSTVIASSLLEQWNTEVSLTVDAPSIVVHVLDIQGGPQSLTRSILRCDYGVGLP